MINTLSAFQHLTDVIFKRPLFSTLTFQEIKPQSHYNHGYNEIVSRKSHVDDYSTWDIVKATQ